jgi:hypothetical protein
MAAPPSTASPVSWNPAVPPPPVTGAAVGIGLNEGLGDGLAADVALALELAEALDDALAGELALALDEAPAEELVEEVGLTVGENDEPSTVPDDEGDEGGLEVQAESATQASTVVRPQPTAVSLALCAVRAMAVRAFIEPPRALGNDHFPVAGRRNRRRKGKRVTGLCWVTALVRPNRQRP